MINKLRIFIFLGFMIGVVFVSGCVQEKAAIKSNDTTIPATVIPTTSEKLGQKNILIEEDDRAFVYSGWWKPENNSGASGGSWTMTAYGVPSYDPIKVDINFSGTGVSLLHLVFPEGGFAEITIDGTVYPNIDMYAPNYGLKKTPIATNLTNSEHIMTITPSKNYNPAMPKLPIKEGGSDKPLIMIDAIEITVPQ